jgi:hypothetical protein
MLQQREHTCSRAGECQTGPWWGWGWRISQWWCTAVHGVDIRPITYGTGILGNCYIKLPDTLWLGVPSDALHYSIDIPSYAHPSTHTRMHKPLPMAHMHADDDTHADTHYTHASKTHPRTRNTHAQPHTHERARHPPPHGSFLPCSHSGTIMNASGLSALLPS